MSKTKLSEKLIGAVQAMNVDLVRSLIDAGVDVNARCGETTPLHTAAGSEKRGSAVVCEMLIDAGADLEAKDENLSTPIMSACAVENQYGDACVKLFIKRGANVKYVRDNDQLSPIQMAAQYCDPEVTKLMIAAGAPVNGPKNTKITPLMRVAVNNNYAAAKTLVELGADIGLKCMLPWAKGLTAEEMAYNEKRKKVGDYLKSVRESRVGNVTTRTSTKLPLPPNRRVG